VEVKHGSNQFNISKAQDLILAKVDGQLAPVCENTNAADGALSGISTAELFDLYNHSPCGYHSLDRDGLIRRINDTELAWLGYARDEVIGKIKWTELLTSKSQQTFLDNFSTFRKVGLLQNLEMEIYRKDGTLFTGLVNATAIYDAKGQFILSRSIVIDISERKKTDELLQFHSEILKNVSEGIFLAKTSNGEIVFSNPSFEKMFGYEPDEIIGKHVSVLNAPSDISPEERAKIISADLQKYGSWRGEILNIKKNGEAFYCFASVSSYEHPAFGKVWVSVHEEITERKKLEENYRESERQLHIMEQREIIQTSLDGFLITDSKTGKIIDVNEIICKVLGYSKEEFLLKNFSDLVQIDTNEKLIERQPKMTQMGYGRYETQLRHKQGNLIDFEISVTNSAADGNVNFAFLHDISQRKKVESLKQTILNSVSAEIAVLNNAGIVVAINQPWQDANLGKFDVAGNPVPSADIGTNYMELCQGGLIYSSERTQEAYCGIRAVMDGKLKSYQLEYPRYSPRQIRWYNMTASQLGHSAADGVVITHTEISERKRAEQQISKSRDQLKAFIAHAPIRIAMLDKSMNYIAVSGRWSQQYSRGHAELIGHNHYEVHPDIEPSWKIVHQQALKGATIEKKNDSWVQNDGSVHWLNWVVLPWKDANELIGGIIISTEDITTQKNMESEIAERRKELETLQKVNVAAQTASAIAHEMSQPLLAIASYNQAAIMMLNSENPNFEEIKRALTGSEQQALRAGRSINELITFLNRKEFSIEKFDLSEEVIEMLEVAKSEHNLVFDTLFKLQEDIPLVQANRTHVQKAILNLIHNGIEAIQESGGAHPILMITLSTVKDNNFSQLTVKDNGKGVKQEDVKRLFEPFYSTKTNGIGMGLAISRSLIEENGGQLWLDNLPGTGATFHLTLPFAK
jgi:PAS domain S-box-containing protein